MATAADLDRLRASLGTLGQLAVARGGLIRAEDWNALVGVVVEMARATTTEASATVPPHQHLGEVTLDWLDPASRSTVGRGPLEDPAQQGRLSALELNIQRLRDAQDAATKRLEEIAARLDEVANRDLQRQAEVTRFGRVLTTIADPKPELTAMRESLASVQSDIATVVDTANRLRDGGRPIDLGALSTRLATLEGLGRRLEGANGAVLDAAEFDRRLKEVAQTTVSRQDLDQAIDAVKGQEPPGLGDLETRIGASIKRQVAATLGNFRGEVSGQIDTRLGQLEGVVDARVATALPGVQATLTGALESRISAARDDAVAKAAEQAEKRLRSGLDATRKEIGQNLAAQTAEIREVMSTDLARQLADVNSTTRAAVAAVGARQEGFAQDVAQLQAARTEQAVAIAAVPQTMAQLRSELRDTLITEAQTLARSTRNDVNAQLLDLTRQQQDRLQLMSTQLSQSAVDAARAAAVAAAQTELATARVSLLVDARGAAREEVGVQFRSGTATNVNLGTIRGLGGLTRGGTG